MFYRLGTEWNLLGIEIQSSALNRRTAFEVDLDGAITSNSNIFTLGRIDWFSHLGNSHILAMRCCGINLWRSYE